MMAESQHKDAAARLRSSLLELLNDLIACRHGNAFAALPDACAQAHEALLQPEYDIVICGEVKRGKSSFVNALIGRNLLPTGVRETTSQVFRISHAADESYALVFDDGHREEISEADLERYGSQTAAEMEELPLLRGRVLRWIEINTPGVFLKPGEHLVDTPGLGALFAAHSEITHRYITNADAVVFVLDSHQPLTQPEKAFLEKCLEITPNVLFVQTKIDQKDEAEWREIQKRNEVLLNTAFHREGRPRFRVFPVSSKHLAEAAQEKDAKERAYLLEDSLFDAARRGLELTIFRATGWTRCAWAAAEATRCVEASLRSLEEQRQILTTTSAAEKEQLRRKKAEVRASFQKQWGAAGAKRNQFLQEMNRILQGVRHQAQYIGATGMPLSNRLLGEIAGLASLEKANEFAKDLPERVQSATAQEWQEIILAAQRQITALDETLPMVSEDSVPLSLNLPRVTVRDPSLWDRIKNTNIDGMVGGSLAALTASFFLTGGLATAAVVVGTVLGASRGYSRIMTQQLEAAKNELRQQLGSLLAQCRNALCAPDLVHGCPVAKVDVFIENTQAQVKSSLEEQFNFHKARMEEQERKLEEQAGLAGGDRASALERVMSAIGEFTRIQTGLKEVVEELRVIQEALKRAEAALGESGP